jgi:hypothetical protein
VLVAAGRATGLLPASPREGLLPALNLVLWSVVTPGAVCFLAMDGSIVGGLSVTWRLACTAVAGTALWTVQRT